MTLLIIQIGAYRPMNHPSFHQKVFFPRLDEPSPFDARQCMPLPPTPMLNFTIQANSVKHPTGCLAKLAERPYTTLGRTLLDLPGQINSLSLLSLLLLWLPGINGRL